MLFSLISKGDDENDEWFPTNLGRVKVGKLLNFGLIINVSSVSISDS